jgi:hypothetical protein
MPPVPKGNIPAGAVQAAKALEVVQAVFADPTQRANFRANPQGTFNNKRGNVPGAQNAQYNHIPPNSQVALQNASDAQMDFLTRLDQVLIAEGLCVDVPSPGALHYF